MIRVFDVLALATLATHRDAVRAVLDPETYSKKAALSTPVLDLLQQRHPELERLEIVRLGVNIIAHKTRDETVWSVFMAGALDWLEAQHG